MESNILDITQVLARPVTNAAAMFQLDPEEEISSAVLDDEPETAQAAAEPAPKAQYVNNGEPGAAPMVNTDFLAMSGVNLLNVIQAAAIPYFRMQRKFTKHEQDILDTLDTTGKTIYQDESEEYAVLKKYRKHEKIIETVPFTELEKQALTQATGEYLKTINVQVTPLQALIGNIAGVMGTRVMCFID